MDEPYQFGHDILAILGGIQARVAAIDTTTKATSETVRSIETRVGTLEQIQARHEGEVKSKMESLFQIAEGSRGRISKIEDAVVNIKTIEAERKGRDGFVAALLKNPLAWIAGIIWAVVEFFDKHFKL